MSIYLVIKGAFHCENALFHPEVMMNELVCAKAFETMEFSVFIDVIGWARESFGHDITVHTCGFQKHFIQRHKI